MVRTGVRDVIGTALRGVCRFRTVAAPNARLRMLAPLAVGLAWSASGAAQPQASDWYLSVGFGAAAKSGLDQVGSNRDTFCYPTDACFGADPALEITGYRWRYAIDADSGTGFEVGVGHGWGAWRVEFAATQTVHDLSHRFRDTLYIDGSAPLPSDGTVFADFEASIDSVRTYIVSMSAFRDWPMGALTAYAGIGAGMADVEIRGVRFAIDYGTDTTQAHDPPLSFYSSAQDADLSDRVPAVFLHLGADYPLNERMRLGAKLTYSRVDDIADTSRYALHPMHARDPDFINENTFGSASGWQLSLVVKFALRR